MALITQNNFFEAGRIFYRAYHAGDEFYERLIESHHELSKQQSQQLNVALIRLLNDEIDDEAVLSEAFNRVGVESDGIELISKEPTSVQARLVLLLCNHVGDLGVLGRLMRVAREAIESKPE